jgi:hypothetical protein
MRRAVVSVVLAVVAVLGFVRPATAEIQPSELAASDVVVESAASLPPADRDRLVAAARDLRERAAPTKFVVVAARPVNPTQTARDLRRAIGFNNGNVLVLSQSPRSLGIASGLPEAMIQEAFQTSVPELQGDPVGGTIAVAQRLAEAATGGPAGIGGSDAVETGEAEQDSGSDLLSGLLFVGLIAVVVVGVVSFTRRSTRRRGEADLADRHAALEPMVDALAAHVTEIGPDLRFAGDRTTAAQPHYDEAVLAYGEVRDAMPSAGTTAAVDSVRETLERGLRAAQSARAVLDGRPIPPPE